MTTADQAARPTVAEDRLLAWDQECRRLRAEAREADEPTSDRLMDRADEIENRILGTPPASLADAAVKVSLVADVIEGGSIASEEDAAALRQVAAFLRPSVPDPHVQWAREIETIFLRHAEMQAMPDPADATEWEAEYQRLFDERWRLTHLLAEHAPLSPRGAAARLRLWAAIIRDDEGSNFENDADLVTFETIAGWLESFAGAGEPG